MTNPAVTPEYVLMADGKWYAWGHQPLPEGPITPVTAYWRLCKFYGTAVYTTVPPNPTNPNAGAVPLGTADYGLPAVYLEVNSRAGSDSASGAPGSPVQTLNKAYALAVTGDTIVMRGGPANDPYLYNESLSISGKTVYIQNYPLEAVWMDGSVVVTGWSPVGATWVRSGWTTEFDHSASFTQGSNAGNFVNPSFPMAAWPDQVFVDGALLAQVATGVTPTTGQFMVDYAADTITIGTNPTGKEIRVSNLSRAFILNGANSKLRGIGVRRYATPLPSIGTIYGGSAGQNLEIENVHVYQNATQGISISGNNSIIRNVSSTYNGMTGAHNNGGTGVKFLSCDFSFNNQQRFNAQPSSGGLKATNNRGIVIDGCNATDNIGTMGLWLDVTCIGFTITNNVVLNHNSQYGIQVELCDTGIVAGNRVDGAKYGITCFDSGNVKVFNNWVANTSTWAIGISQDARRNTGANSVECPWVCKNIQICNNVMVGNNQLFKGYGLDKETGISLDTMGVTVNGNMFYTENGTTSNRMMGWGQGDNVTVTLYLTPAALAAAKGPTWQNVLTPKLTPTQSDLDAQASKAVAIPADVAAVLGVATGAKFIGVPV